MAGINYDLYGGGLMGGYQAGQDRDRQNMLAQQQMQQVTRQNQLGEMQLAEAQRAQQEQNQLRQLYSGAKDVTSPEFVKQVYGVSPQQGMAYEETLGKRQKAMTEGQKAQVDLVDAKLKQRQNLLQGVRTPEQYLAWHESNHADPVLGPVLASTGVTAEGAREQIMQALSQPGGFEKLLQESQVGVEKFREMNKPQVVPAGSSVYQDGKIVVTAPEKEGTLPASAQEFALAQKDPKFMQFLQARAAAGRAPAQPRAEQPPVAVVDPVTGKPVYVSREAAISGKMSPAAAQESLPPKEIQKREASYPQATSSVRGFEKKSDSFIADLKKLRDDPGLENITGAISGRTPSFSAAGSRAQALYDKVTAKGGFQALQDMRDASKTGGALGNVSNQEGKQLTASFSAIDRRQDAADVREAINQAIADIEGSKVRMREAYDDTYSYKGSKSQPAPTEVTGQDKQALDWANANPKDPRAAQIKQRLGR
jgi:hypothetical protein